MKRTIAIILLAVITLLSLASCDMPQTLSGKTPEEALAIVAARMEQEKSLKSTVSMKIDISAQGVTSSIVMDTSVACKQENGKILLDGDMNMTMLGMTVPTSYQIVDGVFYVSATAGTNSQKIKANIGDNMEKLLDQYGSETTWEYYSEITGATIEEKDGKFHIKATMLPDKLEEEILGNMSSITQNDKAELSDLEITMVVEQDGFCESISLSFGLLINGANASCTYTMTYEPLANDFTVTAPEDADTYKEVSFDELVGEAK